MGTVSALRMFSFLFHLQIFPAEPEPAYAGTVWNRTELAVWTHIEPRSKQKYPHSQKTSTSAHACNWVPISGNVRIESGTGNQVLEEPELEEPVTQTELAEPQRWLI